MATAIASQLKAIRSAVGPVAAAPAYEPSRRKPQTRPSVLFDSKVAADLDLRSILPISLYGLDVLVDLDVRFGKFRDSLFSQNSLELDREQMVLAENEKLNKSITNFLRLLAGHLHCGAALRTLEYLIRRYLIHVYNVDELLLCAMPYHDTPAFVRIVQLVELGNGMWSFLEGVKASGAPPPRSILVQQCICDKGLLEALCAYATPTKDFQQPSPVTGFCTAVVVESLGAAAQLDTDIVQRVTGFVFDSLNPEIKGGHDHKAAALMVVGVLATRATLSQKLVQSLIFFISRMAHFDSRDSGDLPWLRTTIMALISLVQLQPVHTLSKKTLMNLKDTRDLLEIICELANEFKIDKFLNIYMESLVDNSISDSYYSVLINAIEVLPVGKFIKKIVMKVLARFLKLSGETDTRNVDQTAEWVKKILVATEKHHPLEFHVAIHDFLKSSGVSLTEENSFLKALCLDLDGDKKKETDIACSNVWFYMDHPKAVVRQSALERISVSGLFVSGVANIESINMQDAVIRGLYDDDIGVVQAALSVDGLSKVANPSILKAYNHALSKYVDIIQQGSSKLSRASDLVILCLRKIVEFQSYNSGYSKEIASIMFPLLLVRKKTTMLNLKALELIKEIKWPFYVHSCHHIVSEMKLDHNSVSSVNMENIRAFAQTLAENPVDYMTWLIESSHGSVLPKAFLLLIMLQAVLIPKKVFAELSVLYEAFAPFLKDECAQMESLGDKIGDEMNAENVGECLLGLVTQISNDRVDYLNDKILPAIFWAFLRAHSELSENTSVKQKNNNDKMAAMVDDLFLFFITTSSKIVFSKLLRFLVLKNTEEPIQFLSKYFTDEGIPSVVQVESLRLLSSLSSMHKYSETSNWDEASSMHLLLCFPSILVPLSHQDKDIRSSAMNCIEGLHLLWQLFHSSLIRNGNNNETLQVLYSPNFGTFLECLVNQKKMISSDPSFLSAYIASIFGGNSYLTLPESVNKMFDEPTRDAILHFVLSATMKFSSYGKMMILSLLGGVGSILLRFKPLKSLLHELLHRRKQHHLMKGDAQNKLLPCDVENLCLLLKAVCSTSGPSHIGIDASEIMFETLRVNNDLCAEDPAVARPCVAVLQTIEAVTYDSLPTNLQDRVFCSIVSLFHSEVQEIRNATRETLIRIKVNSSVAGRIIEYINAQGAATGLSKRFKGDRKLKQHSLNSYEDLFSREQSTADILVSLLDTLLLKKDMANRAHIIQPLFSILSGLVNNDWLNHLFGLEKEGSSLPEEPESISTFVFQAQQTALLVLRDISDSLDPESLHDGLFNKGNVDLLIYCARSSQNVATCNQIYMLLASIAKVSAHMLSESILDLFILIGENAIIQDDSHSQRIVEDLISVLVPCWLSRTTSMNQLFQIFVNALQDVTESRRLPIMVCLLRSLGEKDSLATCILNLLRSLVRRVLQNYQGKHGIHDLILWLPSLSREWEYVFAVQICDQLSCNIWFPSLVKLLQETRASEHKELFVEVQVAMYFIIDKLQDTELIFDLESEQTANYLQVTLGELMKEVVYHLYLLNVKNRELELSSSLSKKLRDSADCVLMSVIRWISASTYFDSITELLEQDNKHVQQQALSLLRKNMKRNNKTVKAHGEVKGSKHQSFSNALQIDESAICSFNKMCLKIVQMIDSTACGSDTSVVIAAVSSLEMLAKEYAPDTYVYETCLQCIAKYVGSEDLLISSGVIRAVGSLISVLGSKALPQLPSVMKSLLVRFHKFSPCPSSRHTLVETSDEVSCDGHAVLLSIMMTVEIIVEKLSMFINPYLDDILDLIVLHQDSAAQNDSKLHPKEATVQKLLTEKVPVRLLLPAMLKLYDSALKCGERSLSLNFQMLARLVALMDRTSVGTYYIKIYEHCLAALDLRRQLPESVRHIEMAEESVVQTMVSLTMKLTENMFRPLFLQSLEWAESEVEAFEPPSKRSLARAIAFYHLVNNLAEQHRSLFVPYFKYLLENSIRFLTEDQKAIISRPKQKKKAKVTHSQSIEKPNLQSLEHWCLRALIVKCLHKCFLYDTDHKFLDTSKFTALLKPITSQFTMDPPESLDSAPSVPSTSDVDESLVLCLGQMAVTAGSDAFWKTLNHEVLMQTRSDRVRPKMLGLRVVKYLVEHLKEEYLVLLPEIIPFLAELIEDAELSVKTVAQQVLKEMEMISGEDIRKYL